MTAKPKLPIKVKLGNAWIPAQRVVRRIPERGLVIVLLESDLWEVFAEDRVKENTDGQS